MSSTFSHTLPAELRALVADRRAITEADVHALSNDEVAWALADALQLPMIPLRVENADLDLYFRHRSLWEEWQAVPLYGEDLLVVVACATPWDQTFQRRVMTTLQRDIRLVGVLESELATVLADLLPVPAPVHGAKRSAFLDAISAEAIEFKRDRDEIIESFKALVLRCRAMGASDIHIEPFADRLCVRARLRGTLETLPPISTRVASEVTTTLKAFCGIPTDRPSEFHDGKATIELGSGEIPLELRVMTGPTAFGEAFSIRLLDANKMKSYLGTLPFGGREGEILRSHLDLAEGLVLVTGPTGSGKTTTLYRCLSCVDRFGLSVQSFEQPVEYKIDMVRQYEIPRDAKFGAAVRALLRSDPDVALIGEIRDRDTAETCLEVALTGHLTFSTLHVTSALEVIPRLRELGVPVDVIVTTLSLVIAQRLVATLCKHCKRPVPVARSVRRHMEARFEADGTPIPDVVYEKHGCKECFYTGIGGVTPIFELWEPDDEIRDLIRADAKLPELRAAWDKAGGRPLIVHGLREVAAGNVAYSEVVIYETNRQLVREIA